MSALIHALVAKMQAAAATGAEIAGQPDVDGYLERCKVDLQADQGKGVRFTYSRFIYQGQHALSLALSFRPPPYTKPAKFDHRFARRTAPHFFGGHLANVFAYPPNSVDTKTWQVWYFILFTTPEWVPLGPPAPTPSDAPRFAWATYEKMLFPW